MNPCPSGKREYLSPGAAQHAMKDIRVKRRRGRNKGSKVPVRSYRCPQCAHWHLTSSPVDSKWRKAA